MKRKKIQAIFYYIILLRDNHYDNLVFIFLSICVMCVYLGRVYVYIYRYYIHVCICNVFVCRDRNIYYYSFIAYVAQLTD